MQRIESIGSTNLRRIEKQTGFTADTLEAMGFDVDRHNHKLKGRHICQDTATKDSP